jgi:hypothetical protein
MVDQHQRDLLTEGVGGVQQPHCVVCDELPTHPEVAAEAAL